MSTYEKRKTQEGQSEELRRLKKREDEFVEKIKKLKKFIKNLDVNNRKRERKIQNTSNKVINKRKIKKIIEDTDVYRRRNINLRETIERLKEENKKS